MGADPDSAIAQEEIFGPVLVVIPFADDDEAVRLANGTAFGLAGAVLSGSLDRGLAVARRIRTGAIGVNGGMFYGADAPFGGYKSSGIGRQCGTRGSAAVHRDPDRRTPDTPPNPVISARSRARSATVSAPKSPGGEGDRQGGRGAERLAVDVRVVVGEQFDVGQAVQQALQGDPGLHPGQMQAHAGVLAGGEGDVRQALAEDVELLRVSQRVSSRLAEPMQTSITASPGMATPSSSVSSMARALHGGQRRLEAQALLDRRGEQLVIGLHRRELLRMRQQQIEQVARRPVGGFQPGGQQQPQERVDRFVAELLAVDLGGDQIADDVSVGLDLRSSICSRK